MCASRSFAPHPRPAALKQQRRPDARVPPDAPWLRPPSIPGRPSPPLAPTGLQWPLAPRFPRGATLMAASTAGGVVPGQGALTQQQQMAVTQVVATMVPLPLPWMVKTQVVGQVVGSLSQTLEEQLTPPLKRKLARGKALSERELDEVAQIMARATEVPLLDGKTAKPIFRAVANVLFGEDRLQVISSPPLPTLLSSVSLISTDMPRVARKRHKITSFTTSARISPVGL